MSNELPACQKCKLRKVRCDRQAPKCTSCTKGNVACIVVNPATGEQYARDYQTARGSRGRGEGKIRRKTAARSETSHDTIEAAQATPAGLPTGGSHAILSEAKWQRHRTRILDQLATRPGIQQLHLSPNPLPAVQEAEQLLEKLLYSLPHTSHIPLRQEVLGIFNRVYNASATSSDQDYFRLLMVFAISATTRYRAGITNHHPYDYFIAAEDYLGRIPLIRDIDLCMRQCIEWKLHLKPVYPLDPLVEQHRRRVFWECYVLDRYSSGILGRPFAIAESDIDITSLDLMPKRGPGPSELSVFIICIQLRRISSRIHSTFYSSRSAVASNATSFGRSTEFKSYWSRLYSLHTTTIRTERMAGNRTIFLYSTILYERPEWHDFLHEKDVLLLARGAVHKQILTACFVSASRIIELYSTLMEKRAITWTRSYFQVIFTAGLTVTFCISLELLKSILLCLTIRAKCQIAASAAVVFDVLKDECLKDNLSRV
ncbi:hypothetical protein J3E73DRAFT_435618 [Bipolaris maydis]|nr:hypothetical protein J3E73DRAFT_435618 [Bipolaris maydis]